MYVSTTEKNDEIEIDLKRLFSALLKKAWLIAIVSVVSAVVVFLGTLFFVEPKYQSSAMFYVNNSSFSLGEASLSISSADITASKSLVNSYIVILNTRESLMDVIDYAGVKRTYAQVKNMISASAVSSTEIFRVTVTSTDPVEAEKIADAIAYVLPKRISNIIEGTSAKVVDAAVLPSRASSPNYTRNAMLGFMMGLMLSAFWVVIRELVDITIRTEEDIAQRCKYPVLASVPDMELHSKDSPYYGYGKPKKSQKKSTLKGKKQVPLVGGNISFAAAEAYKLLRTKLQFSFADEANCRIIGVSSAIHGEGKSLTSVNLACSMAQLGKRVLLIDCDMRQPSLAEKLSLDKSYGLSDYLTGQSGSTNLIQSCSIKDNDWMFHAISAGRIPPNPMELLSSARMEKVLATLREKYDYIILDLPPVGEVGDALAAAKLTDGMLVVVRQHYCNRIALNTSIRQFEFVDTKILGVVFNCTIEETTGYRSRYYSRYYRRYYGRNYSRSYQRYGEYSRSKRKAAEE